MILSLLFLLLHTFNLTAIEIQVQNDNVENPIFKQMMFYYQNKETVINWRKDLHRICVNLDGLMINRILSLAGDKQFVIIIISMIVYMLATIHAIYSSLDNVISIATI